MEDFLKTINKANVLPEVRLRALKNLIAQEDAAKEFPETQQDANIMLKTIFSFSPYTPTMAAYRARKAGLSVAGATDTDSINAVQELKTACDILKIGFVSGFEFFVNIEHTPFHDKVLNTPYSPGIVRMHIHAIPSTNISKIQEFLIPIFESRHARNRKMVDMLNDFIINNPDEELSEGYEPVSYDNDVLPLSMANFNGFVTQRHILAAIALKLIKHFPSTDDLVLALRNGFGIKTTQANEARILSPNNPHLVYDVVEVLFDEFLSKIFVQPDDWECVSIETANEFAQSTGGVVSYFYHGDRGGRPFEDSYLDNLFPFLKEWGFAGITFVPSLITSDQFRRVTSLCRKYDFMQIVGSDIYGSRGSFSCPLLRRPEFSYLLDGVWALVAHENLVAANKDFGLFSPNDPLALAPLDTRIKIYGNIGRQLAPCGVLPASEAMKQIYQKQRDFIATLKARATLENEALE